MKSILFIGTLTAALAFAQSGGSGSGRASAELRNAKGEAVGTVRVEPGRGGKGVRLRGDVQGLPPGEHGIHVHSVGKCDPPDFTTAGPHFNPTSAKHSLHTQGGHVGDLGNLNIGANGKGKIDITLPTATLGEGANSLFHEGGTALVIHANPDDLKTDPAGNAGARIACGVITR